METEIYEFLLKNLTVEVSMDTEHECDREYATCSVSVRIRNPETGGWVEVGRDYGSTCIRRD